MDRKNKANEQHVRVGTDASARIQWSGSLSSAVGFALLQRAVDFIQSLFDAQGGESSRWVLVPALFHELHQSRQGLRSHKHALDICFQIMGRI